MSDEPDSKTVIGSAAELGGASENSQGESSELTGFTRDALLTHIPENIRNEQVFQNLNAENPLPDLANQFLNAQKMIGANPIQAPQENWGDEQWSAFWDKAGRPETPDKYTLPEVEGVEFDEAQMTEFKDFAHRLGVPDKQFGPLMQKYAETQKAQAEAESAKLKETVTANLNKLRSELANEGKDFDRVVELANEGLRAFEDDSLTELFQQNPSLANHPAIIKTLATIAETNRESLARSAGLQGRITGATDAMQTLQSFEQKHADVIYGEPEKMSWNEREARDRLLKQRSDLYQLAYPPEERA